MNKTKSETTPSLTMNPLETLAAARVNGACNIHGITKASPEAMKCVAPGQSKNHSPDEALLAYSAQNGASKIPVQGRETF